MRQAGINPIETWLDERRRGGQKGLCSICSAHPAVLAAAMDAMAERPGLLLIEATANQVDMFGGYTGMTPPQFRDFVHGIADGRCFDRDRIVLGGDHLGPLTWMKEEPERAMELAETLVEAYVSAGFQKIHLDASMRLNGDPAALPLALSARRAARLAAKAEAAWQSSAGDMPPPVYVIGSEVPVPGGETDAVDAIAPTTPESLMNTLESFEAEFRRKGLEAAWQRVVAVVVQPGVDFGEDAVRRYDRKAASRLITAAGRRRFLLEGHSTDYQPAAALRELVGDGVAFLKVGPALTREYAGALHALACIEAELGERIVKPSGFRTALDDAMARRPERWMNHCSGGPMPQDASRRYNLSDRGRYFLGDPAVEASIRQLFDNLEKTGVPASLVLQYMPRQFERVADGRLKAEPAALAADCVALRLEDYFTACGVPVGGRAT